MQCPKCNHKISDQSKSCLYCGAPIGDEGAAPKTFAFADKNGLFIQTEQTSVEIDHKKINLEDLPEDMRLKLEEAMRQGKNEVVIEKTSTVSNSLDTMPLEKISSVLAKMKDLLDRGQMNHEVYEPMALSIIKDYLATLDDKAQLTFLDDKLPGIALHKYMTEGMFKKLGLRGRGRPKP
ncbi:MAG: zinc ribbon domain-containing protein [Deltaproteobacteria bacterium]|nr:zinc ribbon domain-containing protein [Deltaproteobacteria bacterium]